MRMVFVHPIGHAMLHPGSAIVWFVLCDGFPGETAAGHKSANPAAPRLGGWGISRKLCRERQRGKPEQQPKQEPKIRI
jgi:hypothetical protein